MDQPLTKRDALKLFLTKREALDLFLTKSEFHDVMKNLFGYLDERFATVRADLARTIQVEIRRATKGTEQRNRDDMAVIDEKYKDLPDRVSKLEAKVFAPKRQRRR